jgi:uncharacterized UBP type Zn finger protein
MSELVIPNLGFVNTGAICYFNSLVQSLLSCDSFLGFICKEKQDSIFYLFFKFIAVEKQWDSFFTSKLLHTIGGFEPNQSASEYFLKVCDFFKLDDLFKTNTETTTKCKNCGKENKIMDISVYTIIDNDLKEFCETVREVEGFNCDGCNQKVSVVITSQIKQISPIMVFTFNKYFEKKNIHYSKGFEIDNKKYRLLATIEHHGVLQGGHYFCRVFRNNEWLQIDDNNVSKLEDIQPTENTYMVFYERIN